MSFFSNLDFFHTHNAHAAAAVTLGGVTGGLLGGTSVVGWISAICAVCGVVIQLAIAIHTIRSK